MFPAPSERTDAQREIANAVMRAYEVAVEKFCDALNLPDANEADVLSAIEHYAPFGDEIADAWREDQA